MEQGSIISIITKGKSHAVVFSALWSEYVIGIELLSAACRSQERSDYPAAEATAGHRFRRRDTSRSVAIRPWFFTSWKQIQYSWAAFLSCLGDRFETFWPRRAHLFGVAMPSSPQRGGCCSPRFSRQWGWAGTPHRLTPPCVPVTSLVDPHRWKTTLASTNSTVASSCFPL